jgi:hypothetical protein
VHRRDSKTSKNIDVKNVFYVFYFSHVFSRFLTCFIFAKVFYYKDVGKVANRINDVLYSIRTSPRARLILAHIDRLRRYEGDVPTMWKYAPNVVDGSAQVVCREDAASNGNKIESPTTVLSNIEEGRDKPTLLTAEAAVAETGDNTGEIDTGAQQDVTHRRFERGYRPRVNADRANCPSAARAPPSSSIEAAAS